MTGLDNQVVKLAKAVLDIVVLLATVVGLNDQRVGFGGAIPGVDETRSNDGREKRQ